MNRVRATACMLVLVLETGCPVGGDAGVLHQALLRDELEKMARDSCQPADVEEVCGPKKYDECMASCVEEMRRRARK